MLRDMWDLPGSGIEPTSPALAGGLFTMTKNYSKSLLIFLYFILTEFYETSTITSFSQMRKLRHRGYPEFT